MIRKLTLKKEREHETNEASIAGNVMRDLIAHVTNDNLIGRKIKSGELRKKMVEPPWKCPEMFTMTTISMEHFTMEWLELKEASWRWVYRSDAERIPHVCGTLQ